MLSSILKGITMAVGGGGVNMFMNTLHRYEMPKGGCQAHCHEKKKYYQSHQSRHFFTP